MARDDNSFALLGDEEGDDDVSTFLAHVAKKAEDSSAAAEKKKMNEQQQKRNLQFQSPPAAPKFPSKPLPPAESVRAERWRGTGGQGRGSGRSSWNDVQHFEKGHPNSYQPNNRGVNGYKQNNGGSDGYRRYSRGADGSRRNGGGDDEYQHSSGNADSYQGSYGGDTAGNKDDGNSQGWVRVRGRGGRGARGRGCGQGRALNENNGFEKESQFVEGNQQLENQDEGRGGGWETVTNGHSFKDEKMKQHRNGNSNYGGDRRGNGGGFFGAQNGRNYGSGEVITNSGSKEALSSNGGDDDSGIVAAATEVSAQDAAHDSSERKAQDEDAKEARRKAQEEEEKEAKRKAWEEEKKEEAKKMTLEQYQKVLLEKRKALETLKTEERKVTLDKDFESMKVIGRKTEDSLFIKQDSEKDKLKKKDDKVRKLMNINVFLKPAEGEVEKYDRRGGRGRGGGGGGYNKGSSNWQAADPANSDAQQDRFPKQAKGEEYVGNFDRRGGQGGGYRRGSSADSSNMVARHNEVVKRVPVIEDASQFPGLGGSAKP